MAQGWHVWVCDATGVRGMWLLNNQMLNFSQTRSVWEMHASCFQRKGSIQVMFVVKIPLNSKTEKGMKIIQWGKCTRCKLN